MPGDWDDDGDDGEHFDDGMDALDFDGPAPREDDWSGLDALDDHQADPETAGDPDTEQSGWETAPDHPVVQSHTEPTDFDVYGQEAPGDDEADSRALFTVSHPSHLLSVTASISGGIFAVDLSPEVSRMTESQLAHTIKSTADLASLKGQSVQYEMVQELMSRAGVDDATVTQYLSHDIGLPTPQRAAEAEALAVSQYLRETHP